jgi:uncharacterized protein YcbX
MPSGMFFDIAVVHLLTTPTIDRLRAPYPDGRFEVRRFRPDIVSTDGEDAGFMGKRMDRLHRRDRRQRWPGHH